MTSPARARRALAATMVLLVALLPAACGGGDTGDEASGPRIVVTTPVLGALVSDLVGDGARVEVLMPGGVDPHDFQPSAKDAERLRAADLVVVNGLDLEQGLTAAVGEAERDGVPVFRVTDHVALRELGEEAGHDEEAGDAGHDHAEDPHVWTDPVAMSRAMAALAPVVRRETGLDVAGRLADQRARLAALDDELAGRARTVPPARRVLVTGHESLGYFADRYGFRVVGAIIPSLSSQAEPSARQLEALTGVIRREGVPAVFTELGTPPAVAEALAEDAGVRLVEIPTHTLPEDGRYDTFMRRIMDGVVEGLGTP